jgi:hypothetical protein
LTLRENEMLKPTLENFDTIWIKTSQEGKRTACIVKIEGIGRYAKHWKKQIKLSDALEMIKSMTLESSDSAMNKIEVYVK